MHTHTGTGPEWREIGRKSGAQSGLGAIVVRRPNAHGNHRGNVHVNGAD